MMDARAVSALPSYRGNLKVVTTESVISKIDVFALRKDDINIFALARMNTTTESVMSEIDVFASTADKFFAIAFG
eukprot:1195030-Heterocapsa_arctica.AAC.1